MKIWRTFYVVLLSALVLHGCAPGAYTATNKVYNKRVKELAKIIRQQPMNTGSDSSGNPPPFIATTNFGLRKPNFVIIHHTAQQSCEQTLQTFTRDSTQVSAHYLVCKDGTVHHLLNDYLRAWHAGAGRWGNATDINSVSIGIELDNNGLDSFTEWQLQSLELLLSNLKKNYNIPAANFLGHADIAPGRKVDPGILFPWRRFADSGYGLWFADTTNIAVPEGFDARVALKIVGYDVSREAAAAQSFRLHFLQSARVGALIEPEKKVLYALMLQQL